MNLTKHERAIYNRGARKALSIVIAKVRREHRAQVDVTDLINWLLNADKRYQAKPGGIGRRGK